MTKKLISILLVLCVVATGLFAGGGNEVYPSKDIEFTVGAGAGGGSDTTCRKILQLTEPILGGTFYVTNRPGASDCVGPNILMTAKPDGYSLGNLTYGAVVTGEYQQIMKGYTTDNLDLLCMITREADSFTISSDAPYKTWDEFIQYAKDHPGQVRVGDQGIGSRVYLLVTKVEQYYGVQFNKISYTSSAPQREALLNGEVDCIVSSLGDFAPIIQSGDAIGILEFSEVRNPTYPDVPTAKEIGLPDEFISGSFIIIAGPKGLPEDVKTKLVDSFRQAATSQEFADWAATVGITPSWMEGDELLEYCNQLKENDFAALDVLKEQGLI